MKIKYRKEVIDKIKKNHLQELSGFIGVTDEVLEQWIKNNDLRIYSYPIVRKISTIVGISISKLFE